MRFRKYGNKRVLGIKCVMFRLNIHVFISFYNCRFLCLIFQVQIHFFFTQVIVHIAGTTILSGINVDRVFLASHNNRHNHIHSNRKWLKQSQSHFHQPFFGVLMYSLYCRPNFDLKQKCQQYGSYFQTIFPFLMTMIQHIMSDASNLMLFQYSIKS